MTLRRATLHTIGCRLNQAETAILADRLKATGYRLVDFGEDTDLLIVNTCSVTEGAESDCRSVVRRILRKSPNAFVAVTGCYAQTGVETLRSLKGVDLVLSNQYKMQLPEYVAMLQTHRKRMSPEVLHTRKIDHESFVLEGAGDYSNTRANLKIQDGCQFMCSFCIIPFARGRERSRFVEDAVREAETLADRGHRELVLTGVNIGQYRDRGTDLLDLIRRLEQIEGIERIRISSIEPTTIPDALLEYMQTSKKLCPHLHIPLQSGDDHILQAMNRRYSVDEFSKFIEKAVATIPDLCVGTDVMVGFPGEGEPQFSNTRAMLTDLPFAYLHVFSFSQRQGTGAARMNDKVLPSVIKTRSRALAELSRAKRVSYYQRFIGSTVDVIFESKDQADTWTGLTDRYVRVSVPSSRALANTINPVVITGVMDGLAMGQLVKEQHVREKKEKFTLVPSH